MRFASAWRNVLYRLASPLYFETPERYCPARPVFTDIIRSLLPSSWSTERHGPYFRCLPTALMLPVEGWMVHISATEASSIEVLRRVVTFAVEQDLPFEFLPDPVLLQLANGDQWSDGANAFITIPLPPTASIALEITEKLATALEDCSSPGILWAQQFRGSNNVHYSYGAIAGTRVTMPDGYRMKAIRNGRGDLIPAPQRQHFEIPPHVVDPFRDDHQGYAARSRVLKDGCYRLVSVLSYRPSGGVYRAVHKDGSQVVIKEARPYTFLVSGVDAISALQQEALTATRLSPFGVCPPLIETFEERDRLFATYPHVPGISFHSLVMQRHPFVRGENATVIAEFVGEFCRSFQGVADLFERAHRNGIALGDLSLKHIRLKSTSEKPVVLNLERSYFLDSSRLPPRVSLWADMPAEGSVGLSAAARERLALGSLMLAYLLPVNPFLDIFPERRHLMIETIGSQLQLPPSLMSLIAFLLDPQADDRTSISCVSSMLEEISRNTVVRSIDRRPTARRLNTLAKSALAYVTASCDYGRSDRLMPADPAVYETNGAGIGYGAAGAAYMLAYTGVGSPHSICDWICDLELTPRSIPAGLFNGFAGLAFVFAECGRFAQAEAMSAAAGAHPDRFASFGLFHGAAGCALSEMHLFRKTSDELHLRSAIQTGKFLTRSRIETEKGCCWDDGNGIQHGLGHGGSGIGLTLLYLYKLTGDEELLDIAIRAFQFELSAGVATPKGGLGWREYHLSRGRIMPYLEYGSAGVGIGLVRLWSVVREQKYREDLNRIAVECATNLATLPGYCAGLAGMGHFLLDLHQFLEEPSFLKQALTMANGVEAFGLPFRTGTAFPGHGLIRISCDFGTGGAGVAGFLFRVTHLTRSPLMLDELLINESDAQSACETAIA